MRIGKCIFNVTLVAIGALAGAGFGELVGHAWAGATIGATLWGGAILTRFQQLDEEERDLSVGG